MLLQIADVMDKLEDEEAKWVKPDAAGETSSLLPSTFAKRFASRYPVLSTHCKTTLTLPHGQSLSATSSDSLMVSSFLQAMAEVRKVLEQSCRWTHQSAITLSATFLN